MRSNCDIELPSGEVVDEYEYSQACVRDLVARGPEGIEALLDAVRSPSSLSSMPLLAAEALGDIDDERVLPALLEAFRKCFVGRSSRRHLSFGILCAGLSAAIFGLSAAGLLMGFGRSSPWPPVLACCTLASMWLSWRFRAPVHSTHVLEAVTASILRIAERNPSPQMAAIVEDLKVVAADRIQHGPKTRRTAREVAVRLESLTEQIKSLPVASGPAEEQERTLPRPAATPEENIERLPRVCS